MKEKKDIKLYNVMFPIWMLWLFPVTWLIILPGNFCIDLLVTVIAMKVLRVKNIKENAKKSILYIWVFGFIADFLGVAAMFIGGSIDTMSDIYMDPFRNSCSFLWVTGCVLLSAVCIYFFNKKICLRKTSLSEREKKQVSLSLAVFTAPYLFYLPTTLLYG